MSNGVMAAGMPPAEMANGMQLPANLDQNKLKDIHQVISSVCPLLRSTVHRLITAF